MSAIFHVHGLTSKSCHLRELSNPYTPVCFPVQETSLLTSSALLCYQSSESHYCISDICNRQRCGSESFCFEARTLQKSARKRPDTCHSCFVSVSQSFNINSFDKIIIKPVRSVRSVQGFGGKARRRETTGKTKT
jgi:hypothetical protein